MSSNNIEGYLISILLMFQDFCNEGKYILLTIPSSFHFFKDRIPISISQTSLIQDFTLPL